MRMLNSIGSVLSESVQKGDLSDLPSFLAFATSMQKEHVGDPKLHTIQANSTTGRPRVVFRQVSHLDLLADIAVDSRDVGG